MKRLWTIVVFIVFFVIFVVGSPVMINASEESECFKASQSEGEG